MALEDASIHGIEMQHTHYNSVYHEALEGEKKSATLRRTCFRK